MRNTLGGEGVGLVFSRRHLATCLIGLALSVALAGCYSIGEPDWSGDDVTRASQAAHSWVVEQPDLPRLVRDEWDSEVVYVGPRIAIVRFEPDQSADEGSLEVVVDMQTMEVVSHALSAEE